MKMYEVAYSNH